MLGFFLVVGILCNWGAAKHYWENECLAHVVHNLVEVGAQLEYDHNAGQGPSFMPDFTRYAQEMQQARAQNLVKVFSTLCKILVFLRFIRRNVKDVMLSFNKKQ